VRERCVVVAGIIFTLACGARAPRVRSDGMTDAVYSRSTAALGCAQVVVTPVGGNGYVAQGCGLAQSYTCMRQARGFHYEVTCVPDGAPIAVAASTVVVPPAPLALTPTDEQIVRAAGTSCGVVRGALQLEIATTGTIQSAALDSEASSDVGQCIAAALRASSFAPSAAPRAGTVPLDASAVPSTSPTIAEIAARAIVDEQRDVILACSSATAVGVVASWTADGHVSLALSGALTGTPEDGCVRALVVGTAIAPAPGTPGSVLHAVHR
jgi:hypothetical protein